MNGVRRIQQPSQLHPFTRVTHYPHHHTAQTTTTDRTTMASMMTSSSGAANTGGNSSMGPPNSQREVQEVREQDRFLPIANISRIMKKSLPPNAKIAKDAKETVQECVSEFISFVTSEASEKCQKEKRKTINGEDLLWAMSTLGFNKYVEPLKHYLTKYREVNKEDSNNKKKEAAKKLAAQKAAQAAQAASQASQAAAALSAVGQ